MHLEIRHLRSLKAISECGSISAAAEVLGITQSALSHQVKYMEEQTQTALIVRGSRPAVITEAGRTVVEVANKVLPQMEFLESELFDLGDGRSGRLHIALECHACYDWVLPVMEKFRQIWPNIDLDIRPGLAYDALRALRREEIDVAISTDPSSLAEFWFSPLFDYEAKALISKSHRLVHKPFLDAKDFSDETLLTYPVPMSKLDIFTELLDPENVSPAAVRAVELTDVVILLVASGRGIAVLPDWVFSGRRVHPDIETKPVTQNGLTKRLYSATRKSDSTKPYIAYFNRLARQDALKFHAQALGR